ncbi:DNA (cytosine-5)-methyltransferase 1 [Streptomyces qinglanensis]|uniref:DNA (cytosine-5-)-methyltransferase n=1 Tax=Streptomyces qinglanensis TaxID=943816 RepID=A0A1H9Q4M6_9ACTN|nr:DNA (cytosine-5)-methyltransferase 1 [Streptomyces qinglanensis]
MNEASPALRLGSLCTGYGGLDMAVQDVFGGELAWVCDNDPGAAAVLDRHHPHVPNLDDLTALDWHQVEPVDIVTGGYPCQPFSTAGKRKGTADDRHIWPHIARALGVLRPRLAVFENVAGHLSLGFDTVLADLAALGFDARWCCVRASDIGAAHQRKRLFLLAWPAHPQGPGRQGPRLPRRTAHRGLAAAHPLHLGSHGHRARGAGRDEPPPRRLAPADTGGGGLERCAAIDRAASAQFVTDADGPRLRPVAAADAPGDRRQQRGPEPAGQQGGSDAALGGAPDWGPYREAVHRWEAACRRPAPGPTDPVGRLNPPFVEWLMGLPPGYVTDTPGLSRTAQLKALGNGVIPQQAAYALRLMATPGSLAPAA